MNVLVYNYNYNQEKKRCQDLFKEIAQKKNLSN